MLFKIKKQNKEMNFLGMFFKKGDDSTIKFRWRILRYDEKNKVYFRSDMDDGDHPEKIKQITGFRYTAEDINRFIRNGTWQIDPNQNE